MTALPTGIDITGTDIITGADARRNLTEAGWTYSESTGWVAPAATYLKHHNVIINLTPHEVRLISPGSTPGDGWTWPAAEGGVARCSETRVVQPRCSFDPFGDGGMQCSIPVVQRTFGAVEGLPPVDPAKPWRMYIVTQFVADACPEREDLLVPTELVRDSDGVIVGCRAFAWRPARK